jgi:hypothetical protein
MEQVSKTEYTEVPQTWIDYYDLKAKNGENPIVFYDDKINIVRDFNKHKTQYIENIVDHGYKEVNTKNGLKLLVKNSDYEALQKYVDNKIAKRIEEAEKNKKNIINNNNLIINSIKQKLIDGVNQSTLTENDKKKFIECIENAATKCEQFLADDSANKVAFLKKFSFYINEQLKDDLIFSCKDSENTEISNENINVTHDGANLKENIKQKIRDAYTIKILVPHIIFIYDFDSEQIITLRTIKKDHEYKYEYKYEYNNIVASINTTPPISSNSKNKVFYIYKAELNPEIEEKLNLPVPSGVGRFMYYLQCFKGLCTKKKIHDDDYNDKKPNGGKRTRKNKKTRKHKNKKVFRKIKSFRKIRKR